MKLVEIMCVSFWLVAFFLFFTYPVLVGDYNMYTKGFILIISSLLSCLFILLSSQMSKEKEAKKDE